MKSPDIKSILKQKGVKPSLHRMKILDYLIQNRNHPTADMIYKDIASDIPTLSKTTIYNTLKTLHEKGVVQTITIEPNEVRFDADMSRHTHFKCMECANIYDVMLDTNIFSLKSIDGHKIIEHHINFNGICKKCQKK